MNRRLLIAGVLLLSIAGLFLLRSFRPEPSAHAVRSQPMKVVSKAVDRPDANAHEDATSHCDHPDHVAHGPNEPCGVRPPGPANPREIALPSGFLDRIVEGSKVEFALPDGRQLVSLEAGVERDAKGVLRISGKITDPQPGSIFLQRQDFPGVAGELVGHVLFEGSDTAWKVLPEGPSGTPVLKEVSADAVVCLNLPLAEEMPQDHPGSSTVPNPPYQSVIPLQSLPGATGVIYLDFDGETGPFPGWYDGNVAHSGFSNDTIRDVWIRVAEDFLPFNLNVTTDVKIWQAAPQGQRIRCIITPTNFHGAGGVAYVGSFNWGGEPTCWSLNYSDDGGVTVVSHEVGHTLGLYHHGHNGSEYYGGQGSGPTSWGPIMGVPYGRNLKQWSNGDYNLATASWQDDLAVISGNNGVAYRPDDIGNVLGTAAYLNIAAGGTVTNQQGIIGSTGEVDAFRFKTSGGSVNLNLVTSYAPNLDIYAELVNASTNQQVAATNPDDPEVNVTLSTSVPAGEYLLKITGVGYPTPTNNSGYSNYGSLGSYRIDGTVAGGESFRGFSIAENTANGSNVGTVTPVNVSGTLTYTISAGNAGNALTMNPSSGALTVANSSALDFETLSTRFDDPATIELFVTISNTTGGSETVRVLVTVTDMNEAPVISTPASVTLLENTLAGTLVAQLTATEQDRYQVPTFSITSGNNAGHFSINSSTGQITVATSPSVASDTAYNLVVQAADAEGQSSSTTVNVTVLNLPDGFTPNPGGLYRTFFHNIGGTTVGDLTGNPAFPNSPDQETFLTSFDGGTYGDNYGSTLRGYLIPPTTGAYTFYIASDDASQLILGTSATQVSTPVIASISAWSNPYDWDAGATSATYNLTAGQPYYIEMRQKEGGGGDHAAAAWSGPGIPRQVIPGRYLAPFSQNYAPRPTGSMSVSEVATVGTVIGTLAVTEVNAGDSLSNYSITAGNEAALFAIDPNTGVVSLAQAGQFNAATTPYYDLTFSVTDNGSPSLTGSGIVRITVIPYALYFDPNGATAGSVANGGNYSWVGNNWVGGQGGTSASGGWVPNAKAHFAATAPASPLAYNVSIAGYNSGVNGGISSIDALNGTVSFIGSVDNFYLVGPMTVRAASGAAIRFNQTAGTPGLGFNLNNQTATFEGDVEFATSGIGNNGNVVVNSGTLGLNAPSQYTGSTTINGGVLSLTGSGQLYSTLNWGNATVTINSGGTLQADRWDGEGSLGQLNYNQGNLVINGGTIRYTGDTNGTGDGAGFVIGASGATLESAAPAGQVWNINASPTPSYGIASNGGALTLTGSGSGLISKAIPGTGALVKNGTGTWTLSGTNTYGGGTTVNGGTLILTAPASLPGAVTITGDTGSVPGGTLSMEQPGIVTWSRNVSGGGRWKVATGSGSQTISLTGSYTGFTGVLEVASGSGKIHLADSNKYPHATATLQLDANTSAFISGGGTFASQIKLYGGTIGEPTFGQLRVGSSNCTLSGAVKLHAHSSIAVDNNRSATLSGVMSDSGGSFGFTKNQPGTLTISNSNNSYSGGTVHAAGLLRTGNNGGKFGIGNLTVVDGLTTSIRHTGGNALGRQAYVYLNGTTSALSIAAGATETVARLYLNGTRQANGSYNSGRITGGGTLIVGEVAPSSPTLLSANANSAVSVQLAWTHASANDSAIKVERSLSANSGFVEIASLPGTARSYEDAGRAANTAYHYRVLAVNAAGNSPYSPVASTTTPQPAPPTGLLATAGPGQVSLSWDASIGAASYVVRRSTNPGGPYTDVASPAATSYLDSGLLDVTYYYVIAAAAPNGGIGDPSAEVSATPSLADSDGVWNLASGGDWMSSENWQSSVIAIGAGRSASFPLSAGGSINQNRSGLAIGALSFSNGDYTIAGNALNLDVSSGIPSVSVGAGTTATIATALNGNEGLAKSGTGTLKLTAYNSYTGGTAVNGGTLEVAGANGGWGLLRQAVTVNAGATLAITGGDGTGFGWNDPVTGITINGGTLTAPSASHIGFGSYATAALNDGGTISGNWQWNGDGGLGFSASGNSTNTITGSLVLRGDAGANHTFTVADGTAATDLQVSANLSDQSPEIWWVPASNVLKSGAGTMILSGSNSYDGQTDIQAGMLVASHNTAFGPGGWNGNTMAWIRDGATLALQGGVSLDEHFHIWGSGVNGLGALRSLSGNNTLTLTYGGSGSGPGFCLRSNTTVGVDTDTLTITGFYEDSGSFGLTKVGAGTLSLTQTSTYTGGTTVNAGKIVLANGNAGGSGRISGMLTVNSGATVETTGDGTGLGWTDQISSVALNGGTLTSAGTIHVWNIPGGITITGGTLQSNNGTSNANGPQLEWNRTSVTTLASADTATIGGRIRMRPDLGYSGIGFTVADGAAATDLLVSAAITEASGGMGLVKNGEGTMTLSGTNTYTGATTISGGRLLVNGSTTGASSLSVASGATLGGIGNLGGPITIQSGGTLAPGVSDTGVLTAASSATIHGKLAIELDGAGCDRLSVSGNLDITNATLDLTVLSGGALQQEYTIANFTSRTGSQFAVVTGLPTGFRITYEATSIKLMAASFTSWVSDLGVSDSTPGGDPDKDGLANAFEYVLGGNPAQNDPDLAPVTTLSGSNIVFIFNRDDTSETADLSLRVEASTNLVNWNETYSIGADTANSSPGVAVSENGTGDDTITVTIPRDNAPAKFVRARAIVTP
ncbi:MAG: hypothetical protein EAZ65_01775 [Verrucomicrobia bacterium]|nr:MAG: hypothetical protein EAZ84_11000 [Verrucomicrobiota bacterium]TAE89074.1 MAG: hypothetical protein EAZ82_00125 [Verrucomicrobiota bacterium]TAF28054.1 MAG: hypothetical protein EAZ71_01780 [Verrucomicrobiota bacterium]TAF42901.1 MAG: hypothetical protein EAZ65_01775 [Verrucomicrobiota bacterium]